MKSLVIENKFDIICFLVNDKLFLISSELLENVGFDKEALEILGRNNYRIVSL